MICATKFISRFDISLRIDVNNYGLVLIFEPLVRWVVSQFEIIFIS